MSKRIIAAALVVLLLSGLVACEKAEKTDSKTTTSSLTEEITTAALTTAAPTATETTTAAATTSATSTTVETTTETTVAETVTKVLTTVKKVVTTKPTSTAVKTTAPSETETAAQTTEKNNSSFLDYRTEDKTYSEELKYGVIRRRAVTTYFEKLEDGTEAAVKEDVSEYYNRIYYSASYEDLLPAAKENADIYKDEISKILKIANEYRAEKGIAPLKLNKELTTVACARAEEIAWSGKHSHYRPNGKYCFSIMEDAGITKGYAGENIGWGFSTAEDVCQAWKNSEGHYENIMNPEFTEIGIGVAPDADPGANYCWTQLFLGK